MSTALTMGVNKWVAADEAFGRGLQAWLDWCREIAKLAENTFPDGTPMPRSHAEYTTQEEIAMHYGKERSRINEAIAIGRDKRFDRLTVKSIPKNKEVIYLLTTLPDEDFKELCMPTTTRAIYEAYKRRLAAPKDIPPPQRPPCPGVEGIGPGLWKYSEGLEEWVQQPAYVEPKPSNKLTPEDIAAHEERIERNKAKQEALFDSLNAGIDRLAKHIPQAVLSDVSPLEFLANTFYAMLQQGGPSAVKLAKQMFSSAYHPDSGKVKHDAELMGSINKALSLLE